MAIVRNFNLADGTFEDVEEEIAVSADLVFVIDEISDRQFFQMLALSGLITQPEALAAVTTGILPPAIEAFVAALPTADQFPARMVLQGGTRFERSHPLTAQFGVGTGMSSEDLDVFWSMAAEL